VDLLSSIGNPGLAQAATAFCEIHRDLSPSAFLNQGIYMLTEGTGEPGTNQQSRGAAFELLFSILLIREGVCPFYTQAEVVFVPNAKFDVLIYSAQGDIVTVSLKTSLRERWKQADLEAFAVRQVHRNSIGILAVMPQNQRDANEVSNVAQKISQKKVFGLTECVNLANEGEAEQLIKKLLALTPSLAPTQIGPLLPSARLINQEPV
jgi:hypothetical protein